jgi:hypothetical protein
MHGINYNIDIIVPLRKIMGYNVMVLEHVLEKCQHIHHVHGRDKMTLANNNVSSRWLVIKKREVQLRKET